MTIATCWQQFLGTKPGEIVRANIPASKMGWRRMKNYLDRHPLRYGYLFGTESETHYLVHIFIYKITTLGERGDLEKILTALFPKDWRKGENYQRERYSISTIIDLLGNYFLSDRAPTCSCKPRPRSGLHPGG